MTYYDEREPLKGAVRELAQAKLSAKDEDLIEYATYTWDSGYCETCSYTEYEFQILLNGEVAYDSKTAGYYVGEGNTFGAFQNWLTDTD